MNIRAAKVAVLRIFRRIRPEKPIVRRTPGTARGRIIVASDFDAPLPKDAGFD